MGRRFAHRLSPISLLLGAVSIAAAASCGGPPRPPERPTYIHVAVNQRAVGIPYGPVVLFRADRQLIAFRVVDVPLSGYGIEYEWHVAPADGAVFESTDSGNGETDEIRRRGSVQAGPLFMQWSRGGKKYGWLYWPEDSGAISVSSITFRSLDSIHLQDPQIFWYRQEMFE